MKVQTDIQTGLMIGAHPVGMEEIKEQITNQLIQKRPDLQYIAKQGPETLVKVEEEYLSLNTVIAIFAENIYLHQLNIANFINNWDVSTATGYLLDQVGCTFFGVSRIKAEPSEATIVLVGNRGSDKYEKDNPPQLHIPEGFIVSISGRRFLTKYTQAFTHTIDETSNSLSIKDVRYIQLKIDSRDSKKVHVRFDTDNISHSSAQTSGEEIAKDLLKQMQKFDKWSVLSNKSIVDENVIGGIHKDNSTYCISLGFDTAVDITIPNTDTNKLTIVEYGLEFVCREQEDDIEGIILAGTEIDPISAEENKKLTTKGKTVVGKIEKAFLWSDSTRITQRETDEEYRDRILSSRTLTTIGHVESIKENILKLPGVTHCLVINNATPNKKNISPPSDMTNVQTETEADAIKVIWDPSKLPKFDIEAHSFCVFVQGGSPYAIANTIYNLTPVGINSSGHRYVEITASNGEKVKVKYARPTPHPISILVTFQKRKSGVDFKSYQPSLEIVTDTIRKIVVNEINKLGIGDLLKVQALGDRFFDVMPWMGYRLIKVADKGEITDVNSSEFKEEKQLTIQPYEFFSIKESDILIKEEALA